jgi:serine/threonine protein kinase, bacterial
VLARPNRNLRLDPGLAGLPNPGVAAYGEPVEGTPFGRYRLLALLGRGGMGEVWRASDTASNNRMVAIKLLPPQLAGDEMFVARFRREAEAAAQLNNPHVIPIHNYGEIDGRLYVDMRLVEGRDLAEVLDAGPLVPERAVRIIGQVATALRAAHKIGLVHRDVKPSNILLDEDDFAYLIDFGIARAADQTGLTSTGTMVGSWHYMAPERLGAGEADARADIYALACVLYECLTAERPFPGGSMESQVAGHLTVPPPRPSVTQPEVPVAFDAVIAKGMAKDPEQRYQSVTELAAAAQEAPTVPTRAPTDPRSADTAVDRGATQADDTVVDYPVTPPPQRIPGNPLDPTQIATPPPDRGDRPLGSQPALPLLARMSRRTRITVAAAVLAVVAAVVATVSIVSVTSLAREPSPQVELPFTGLNDAGGVAVDGAGNLYVTDVSGSNYRVLKLAAGTSTPTELPFTDLRPLAGVAVDGAGNVYVTDNGNMAQLLKLAAGTTTQTVLPVTGLIYPGGVAVDGAGNLYVADTNRVLKLAAGATTQTELPFTGLSHPYGVAVDGAGNLYVADQSNNRVLKLAAGGTNQTELPFTGLSNPYGVAVDGAGNIYVADQDNNRVLKLPAGATTQTVLPFTGLSPKGVAVDSAGNLYVVSNGIRVLKLPTG